MAKEMLVNVSEGEECRIALLENGRLEELYMERTSSTSHVGNIYKGRVTNVEPSIQAAFVDFGLGRNGFLHISDLMPTYFGRAGDDIQESVGRKMARRDRPPIQRCLRRGDEIIVQIIKEGIGTKGPTLSTYLSIPGRILVMMPGMSKFGISRKIEGDDERKRLRGILDSLKPIEDVGFIIRTAGVGKTKTEIQRDLTYLTRLWQNINKKMKEKAPVELYTEGDLVARTVRDVFTSDIDRIVVDNKDVARKIKDFIKILMPRTKNKVELFEDPVPIFHKYNIEKEIEQMYSRHVPLPSGGSLVIDSTEAIVAIDVNSGKFRDHADAETTAFKTDMEAADEIPRQLRLRDLGGVIICDFIDLRFERHRRELEKRLHENLKHDRAKTKVLRMSQFGIIEMTRQRMRPSLKRSIYFDCPHCKGAGLVKTPESMSLDVMRRLAIAAHDQRVHRVELAVCPDVAFYLLNKKRQQLANLESNAHKRVMVRQDPTLALDEMKLDLFDSREGLVFLDELGMRPGEQLPATRSPGRRDDRRSGRHQHGRRDHRGDLRREERELDEERLEIRSSVEALDERDAAPARPEAAPQTPVVSRQAQPDEDDDAEEAESSVIDVEDAVEPMGEGPRAIDDDQNGGRRGRRRRRGRRGRGRGQQGASDQVPSRRATPEESAGEAPETVEEAVASDSEMAAAVDEINEESEGPEPGNEAQGASGEDEQPRKRRRRRGGRRHRRRRERAAATAHDDSPSEPNGDSEDDSDESQPSDEPQPSEEANTNRQSGAKKAESPRRHTPQRIPPAPVVKTGSTDRHIVDDEPIEGPPVSRPRSYADLDELPDDLD